MKMVDLAAAALGGEKIDLAREVSGRLNTLSGIRRLMECRFSKQQLGKGFAIKVDPDPLEDILTIFTPRKEHRVYDGPSVLRLLGTERTVKAINYLDRCIEEQRNQSWLRNQSS